MQFIACQYLFKTFCEKIAKKNQMSIKKNIKKISYPTNIIT